MYDIALTVAACLQSGTRADVAWMVSTEGLPDSDPSGAVVFTPGGGKIGSLAGGVVDGKLADMAGRGSVGRLVDVEITEVDALINELPSAGSARCLLLPADTMPVETWALAGDRAPFGLVVSVDGDEVTSVGLISDESLGDTDDDVQEAFVKGPGSSTLPDGRIVSVFSALAKIVVVGGGPIAEAVARLAGFMGWDANLESDAGTASGMIATLSSNDMVVVAAHDIELAGAALTASLQSRAGYIGSVGSQKMQSDRADWLAYRGVEDLSRISGPAGLDIGANEPEEVAVSIIAEAISARA